MLVVLASTVTTCSTCHRDILPQSRVSEASGAGGERKACFQTGAHAPGVCHHCCRRIPRDHARKRAQGTTILTAFDNPIPVSLQYIKGGGGASYFPVSAITDRLYARNQLVLWTGMHRNLFVTLPFLLAPCQPTRAIATVPTDPRDGLS